LRGYYGAHHGALGYLHLAGVVFRDEAERLEHRLFGAAVEGSTDLSS
jgi:hypothetical protein